MVEHTRLWHLVSYELTQSREEGRDAAAVEALRAELEAAGDDPAGLQAVYGKLMALPVRDDFPFDEPSDLDGIRVRRAAGPRRFEMRLDDDGLLDRELGAWLGRCAGCALGKPVEGMMGRRGDLTSKGRIKRYLTAVGPDEWPLSYYFPKASPASEETGAVGCYPSCREEIAFMETDDDIRYTVLGLEILREHGRDFTTLNVARTWTGRLPYGWVCTAETQAYRNIVMLNEYLGPKRETDSIDWSWVATHDNPYREWIGAQIRADGFGYGAPGDIELAAEFAWRDARMSHVKNGIYGEMLCAAMIAAAFALDDPVEIVKAALGEIPATSRLHKDMTQVIDICAGHGNDPAEFEAVLDEIYALLGHYHEVHTNNNCALVVAALILGGHDFEKVITIAVMGGWDTDCNGATAGSIAGAMLGARQLPGKWTKPLNDKLMSGIIGYHPIAISECARRSAEVARKVRG